MRKFYLSLVCSIVIVAGYVAAHGAGAQRGQGLRTVNSGLQADPAAVAFPRLSNIQRTNLLLGKDFVVAKMSLAFMDRDLASFNSAAVDLMNLIEAMSDEDELLELRKLLTGMLDRELGSRELRTKIDGIMDSFSSRQEAEQRWHFQIGAAATRTVYRAYYSDEAELTGELKGVLALALSASTNVDPELVSALRLFATVEHKNGFTPGQMNDIAARGIALFERIAA